MCPLINPFFFKSWRTLFSKSRGVLHTCFPGMERVHMTQKLNTEFMSLPHGPPCRCIGKDRTWGQSTLLMIIDVKKHNFPLSSMHPMLRGGSRIWGKRGRRDSRSISKIFWANKGARASCAPWIRPCG
jgi:hypothetical protein